MHGTLGSEGPRRIVDDGSPLGKLFSSGRISPAEYLAGTKWRETYLNYLASIGAPAPYGCDNPDFTQERSDQLAEAVKRGCDILTKIGKRVLHAVNSIVVYEEPEELGDFEYTAKAAQKGLAALCLVF